MKNASVNPPAAGAPRKRTPAKKKAVLPLPIFGKLYPTTLPSVRSSGSISPSSFPWTRVGFCGAFADGTVKVNATGCPMVTSFRQGVEPYLIPRLARVTIELLPEDPLPASAGQTKKEGGPDA